MKINVTYIPHSEVIGVRVLDDWDTITELVRWEEEADDYDNDCY